MIATTDRIIKKDPDALLDYSLDWGKWLESGDAIVSVDVVVSDGDVVVEADPAPSFGPDTTTAWVSGGSVGTSATVTFSITTSGGRVDDRTITFNIIER